MTDTQPVEMVGCYNRHTPGFGLQTPQIDRLAAQGIRFDRAYCCQPVCGPARSAMFTGTYPHSNGVWGNSMALDQQTTTMGQRLRDAGLHTAYIGKWHLDGGDYFGYGRCPDGWDPRYWYDMKCYLDELPLTDRQRSRQFRHLPRFPPFRRTSPTPIAAPTAPSISSSAAHPTTSCSSSPTTNRTGPASAPRPTTRCTATISTRSRPTRAMPSPTNPPMSAGGPDPTPMASPTPSPAAASPIPASSAATAL